MIERTFMNQASMLFSVTMCGIAPLEDRRLPRLPEGECNGDRHANVWRLVSADFIERKVAGQMAWRLEGP
jgi:hypothetical protein